MEGNNIEAIRTKKGLSRGELAKVIEKSPLTIWRYENGKSTITDTALRRIAKALDVRIADLFEDDAPIPCETDALAPRLATPTPVTTSKRA